MPLGLWHEIGRQFRNPDGVGGRVIGKVMRVVNRRPNEFAIDALELKAADTVLELGCGPGAALQQILKCAGTGKVYGLDQSETMLAQARAANAAALRAGRVELHCARFEQIPLPDASVDKVLAVNVVYFWTDMAAILSEIRRVLRPAGRVAVYATDAAAMKNWKFAGTGTHRIFDAQSLRLALQAGPFARHAVNVCEVNAGAGVPGLVAVIRPNFS